jgi:hypothetical protein
LDSTPPVSDNISNVYWERVNCQTVLPRDDQAPLSFFIEGRDDYMIDVKNIQMCLSVKFRKFNQATATKENLGGQELVAPYCGFLHTFWKVRINFIFYENITCVFILCNFLGCSS